jgi:hypothetical protein
MYCALVIACGLAIRLVAGALKATEVSVGRSKVFWRKEFSRSVYGFGGSEPRNDDYWHPFFIGLFELGTFPVLMVTENWAYVGAWIGFKALAQYSWWVEHRPAFNRFLIGTALILTASYALGGLVQHAPQP